MALLPKKYDRLTTLLKCWNVPHDDVFYAIENGMLRVCFWLPMRFVERGEVRNRKFVSSDFENKEGFVALRPQDFHRLCNGHTAKLRIFESITPEGTSLRLAYEPPQRDIHVGINDLVVLCNDRVEFEKRYQIVANNSLPAPPVASQFSASNDYRHVNLDGQEYTMGDVQAEVIRRLHDASSSQNPWVHGKQLLDSSGSRAVRLRDIFKNKRDWRKLIVSDGRGYYRLNIPEQSYTPLSKNSPLARSA